MRELVAAVREANRQQQELVAALHDLIATLGARGAGRAAETPIADSLVVAGSAVDAVAVSAVWEASIRAAEMRRTVEQVVWIRESLLDALATGEQLANSRDGSGNPSSVAATYRKQVEAWKRALEALASVRSFDDLTRFKRETDLPRTQR